MPTSKIIPGATFKTHNGLASARVVETKRGVINYQRRNGTIGRFQDKVLALNPTTFSAIYQTG